mgnify:CR=1 FL=1
MKVQIDTTNKIIRVEEKVNLHEFYKAIQKLLSNGEWKEFELDTNTKIEWTFPIIMREKEPIWIPNPAPYTSPSTNPLPQPWYTTCGTATGKQLLIDGVFNVNYEK